MAKAVIYTTPTCVFCKMAKGFFKQHGVDYEEKDVAADHDAAHEMIEKSGQMGVPVIQIGDEIVIGFDEKRLRELLHVD